MRLLLIRHGQTPHNVTGALETAFPGAGVTEMGRSQARSLANALATRDIAGIYASVLVRTQLAADPLAEQCGLDIAECDGLEEIPAGDLDHRLPGGTSGRVFHARYDAAVRAIAATHSPTDTVAVFSHGAAIRAFTALICALDPEIAVERRIMNTGGAVLEGGPEVGWKLVQWSAEPLEGSALEDRHAHDVTGESARDTMSE